MSRIQQFLNVLNDPAARLDPGHPEDPLLLSLMVHVAFADGEVEENEFALLGRLCPDKELGELLMWITQEADKPLDLQALADTYPAPSDRDQLLTFAGHMAWGDNQLETSEVQLIARLANFLGVSV
jgi:uncharacterized tellurite resistance protein B-like protein